MDQSQPNPIQPPIMPTPPVQQPVPPQPLMPPQPPVAQQFGGSAPNTASAKKPFPAKLVAVIAGAVVLVVAIICAIIFIVPNFIALTPEDYEKASDQMSRVRTSSYSVSDFNNCGYEDTAEDVESCLNDAQTKFDEFEKQFKELGKENAIKRDKDIKAEYSLAEDYFAETKEGYTLGTEYIKVFAPIMSVSDTDDMKVAVTDLEKLNLKNDTVKAERDTIVELLKEMIDAYNANDNSALQSAYDEFGDITDGIIDKINQASADSLVDSLEEIDSLINEKL